MFEIKPVAVFDLDGTVRMPASGAEFAQSPTDFKLIDGIEERLLALSNIFIVCGATNQGGVAHEYLTPIEAFEGINHTISLFSSSPFTMVKACFHDPISTKYNPYTYRSLCRKPSIGMLVLMEESLYRDHRIVADWDNSFMVGDRPEDEGCAQAADIKFIHADQFVKMPVDEILSMGVKQ